MKTKSKLLHLVSVLLLTLAWALPEIASAGKGGTSSGGGNSLFATCLQTFYGRDEIDGSAILPSVNDVQTHCLVDEETAVCAVATLDRMRRISVVDAVCSSEVSLETDHAN